MYSNSLSLEEGDVEQGRVEVDKLEEVHLCDETVVIISLCSVQLCNGETNTHSHQLKYIYVHDCT